MPFEFQKTKIPGVIIVQPRIFPDGRGFFMETYKKSEFQAAEIKGDFVQDNHSFSSRGVLRGIHFQKAPYAQGKLVSVVEGTVWDVAVDLRPDSPTYKQWVGVELDSSKGTMFYLPARCGHGFAVLSETAHFLYKCTAEYAPKSEGGVRWDDPELGIVWPVENPLVSPKDAALPLFKESAL